MSMRAHAAPYRQRGQRWFVSFAPATLLVLLAITGTSLAGFLDRGVLRALAKDGRAIEHGEYWRLLTMALVHGSVFHLALNASAFKLTGRLVESFFGSTGFLIVFGLGTGTASLASMIASDDLSVGASGGIMALVGALVTFGVRQWRLLPRRVRWQIFWVQVFDAGATFGLGSLLPRIDNAAHLGGFIAGAVLGAKLGPRPAILELLAARQNQRSERHGDATEARSANALPDCVVLLVRGSSHERCGGTRCTLL